MRRQQPPQSPQSPSPAPFVLCISCARRSKPAPVVILRMFLFIPEHTPHQHRHHTHHDPRKDPNHKLSHTKPSLSFFHFQCLTAHESSEIIPVRGPALPNLPEETLRCLISAVKLFFWFSLPVLPSRSCSDSFATFPRRRHAHAMQNEPAAHTPMHTHRRYLPGRQGIQFSRFSGRSTSPSTNPRKNCRKGTTRDEKRFLFSYAS